MEIIHLLKKQMNTIQKNIKEKLAIKGLNHMDLVRITGLKKSTVYGITEGTSIETIKAIASALDVTIEELIGEQKRSKKLSALLKRYEQLKDSEKDSIYLIFETAIMAAERNQNNCF